jgi:ABC-2 type transport system ATP-binding protein
VNDDSRQRSGSGLSCTGLVKKFEEVVAVDGLDLSISPGECFGLMGPNGAGKTTTLEILEGLTRPDAGEVEILGQRWGSGHDQTLRARIGIQLQETYLADKLTVTETIGLFRSFYPRGRTVEELMTLLGLEAKRDGRVHKLSGGQRQRLALACALVGGPDLLFLDEPTTGLDPQARLRIWEVVESFRDDGGAVLLTTHSMEEAARLCDRVAIMDHGRLIAQGTPTELIDSLGAEQLIHLETRGEPDEEALSALPGVSRVVRRNGAIILSVTKISDALNGLLAELERQGVGLETLTTKQPTLEDVFVSLTGRGLRDE